MSVERVRKALDEALSANQQWEEQYYRLERDSQASIQELKERLREARRQAGRSRQQQVWECPGNCKRELEKRRRDVETSEDDRRTAVEQLEALTSKMEFLERHCEEETVRREEAYREVERLRLEVTRLGIQIRDITEERDEGLAVREQVDIYRQDFLAERDEKRRLADENENLKSQLDNYQRQNGRLALTRDLGIVVSDELIKEQTARWLSIKAPESDDTTLVPRGAGNSAVVECQGEA